MTRADHFRESYASLKETIIGEIKDIVRHQDDQRIEMYETKRCPALVTTVIDDQESEVINEIILLEDNVIASAGVYEDDTYYNLKEFELPFLVEILDSVEKHLEE